MKRTLLCAAIVIIAAPTLAGPEILPTKDVKYATYNPATGKLIATEGGSRLGSSIWAATELSGYFLGTYTDGWTVLDWGDTAGPQDIDGFAIGYGSITADEPGVIDVIIVFYAEENGWNSTDRVRLAGFVLPNMPIDPGPEGWSAWIITIDLEGSGGEFTIDGSDLDGDSLVDFGYTYWFRNVPDTVDYLGPLLVLDPNVVPPLAPGIEYPFDAFTDPNLAPGSYDGTWWT